MKSTTNESGRNREEPRTPTQERDLWRILSCALVGVLSTALSYLRIGELAWHLNLPLVILIGLAAFFVTGFLLDKARKLQMQYQGENWLRFLRRMQCRAHTPLLDFSVSGIFTCGYFLLLYLVPELLPRYLEIPLGVLSGTIVFFLVRHVVNNIRYAVIGGSLKEFIGSTRTDHPVALIYVNEVLKILFNGDFSSLGMGSIHSLKSQLMELENPSVTGGTELSNRTYALLIGSATSLDPVYHHAIWNFSVVPITEVFEDNGNIMPAYTSYFEELKRVYSKIVRTSDKDRIFILPGNKEMQSTIRGHAGWKYLIELHKEYNVDMHEMTLSKFSSIREHHPLYLDDFVLVRFHFTLRTKALVIGRVCRDDGSDGSLQKTQMLVDKMTVDNYLKLLQDLRNEINKLR